MGRFLIDRALQFTVVELTKPIPDSLAVDSHPISEGAGRLEAIVQYPRA